MKTAATYIGPFSKLMQAMQHHTPKQVRNAAMHRERAAVGLPTHSKLYVYAGYAALLVRARFLASNRSGTVCET